MGTASASKKPAQLGFWSIYLLGINGIIGSGAFLLPQVIYQQMNLCSIFVLIGAAVVVSMIALCYADLASRFTGAGAAWLYSYHAFGKFVGYELGIFVWFLGCCTVSAETVALFTTLKAFIPALNDHTVFIWSCIALVVAFGIINFFGRTLVKWVDNISSGAKMATIIIFIIVGVFFVKAIHFSPVIPAAATKSLGAFGSHFGNAFSNVFYFFTGFSFIPIAASQMKNPERNIPKVLVGVMITVAILYSAMFLVAIGILGYSMVKYDLPIAAAFRQAVGTWGYVLVLAGMILSIFGVGFATSFNTPALLSSLADENHMIPAVMGKKNRFDAPYLSILLSTVVCCFLVTQSYLFLVACIVFASFVQYVPSILAVMKFKHTGEFPTSGFSLKGGYTVPILALIVSFYMVFQFSIKTIALGVSVALLAAVLYVFMDMDRMGKGTSIEELRAARAKRELAYVSAREAHVEKRLDSEESRLEAKAEHLESEVNAAEKTGAQTRVHQ